MRVSPKNHHHLPVQITDADWRASTRSVVGEWCTCQQLPVRRRDRAGERFDQLSDETKQPT